MEERRALEPTFKERAERHAPLLMSVVVFVLIVAVNRFLQPNFFNRFVIRSNITTFLPLIMAAIGQTMVVLTGNIDLSLGSIITVVNVVIITLFGKMPEATGLQLAIPILVGVLVGLLAGTVNGFLIAKLRLQAVIATFASNLFWMGLALAVLPVPGGSVPWDLSSFYRSWFLGLPMSVWFLLLVMVFWALLRRTRLIRYFYAVGDAPNAYRSGIRVEWILLAPMPLRLLCRSIGFSVNLDISSGDPLVGHPDLVFNHCSCD